MGSAKTWRTIYIPLPHHRRAHASFHLDLSPEDEERLPSIEDGIDWSQVMDGAALAPSNASQIDCGVEGTGDAEERDDWSPNFIEHCSEIF